jgi:hypothetical protein
MSVVNRLYDGVRQPEYTGENRCMPCTVTNLLITAVGTAALWVVSVPVAVGFAIVAVAAIAVRGYLVPGTPTLTKQYFPDWLLRLFGKGPEPAPAYEGDVDPEAYLLDHGVVTEMDDGRDLELADGFWETWHDEIRSAREDIPAAVGDLLDLDEPRVDPDGELTPGDAGTYPVFDGEVRVAQWPSAAALLADLGAVSALESAGVDVESMTQADAGRLLAGLRVFAESCPECGGDLELGEDTVESCCRTAEVYTYDCLDCDSRVMEIEA